MRGRLRAGVVAGATGVCAEAVWALALQRARRRVPVYDTTRMARRLLRRRLPRTVDRRAARWLGVLMRVLYGPSWGVLAALRARSQAPILSDAIALSGAIWLFELVALPRSGATPSLRDWPRAEVAFDMSNAFVYSVVTCAVLRARRIGARRASHARTSAEGARVVAAE